MARKYPLGDEIKTEPTAAFREWAQGLDEWRASMERIDPDKPTIEEPAEPADPIEPEAPTPPVDPAPVVGEDDSTTETEVETDPVVVAPPVATGIPSRELTIREMLPRGAESVERSATPVSMFGIPCVPGELAYRDGPDGQLCDLKDAAGTMVGTAWPAQWWPDDSVRWLTAVAKANPGDSLSFEPMAPNGSSDDDGMITAPVEPGGEDVPLGGTHDDFVVSDGTLASNAIASITPYVVLANTTPRATFEPQTILAEVTTPWLLMLRAEGSFAGTSLDGRVWYTFRQGSSYIEVRVEVVNSALGATKQMYREIGLQIVPKEATTTVRYYASGDDEPQITNELDLHQGYRFGKRGSFAWPHPSDNFEYLGASEKPGALFQQAVPGTIQNNRFKPSAAWLGARVVDNDGMPGPDLARDELRWLEVDGHLSFAMKRGPVSPGSGFRIDDDSIDVLLHSESGDVVMPLNPGSNRSFTVGIGIGMPGPELYAALEYPVMGFAAPDRYAQSGAFFDVTELPSAEQTAAYWQTKGGWPRNAWRNSTNVPLVGPIVQHWRRSYYERYAYLVEVALGGRGGLFTNAVAFADYVADCGLIRSDDYNAAIERDTLSYRELAQNPLDGAHQTVACLFTLAAMTGEPWYDMACRDYGEMISGRSRQGFFNIGATNANMRAWLRTFRAGALTWDYVMATTPPGETPADGTDALLQHSALVRLLTSEIPDTVPLSERPEGWLASVKHQHGIHPEQGQWFMGDTFGNQGSRAVHSFFAQLWGDTMQQVLPILGRWDDGDPERSELIEQFEDAVDAFAAYICRTMILYREDATPFVPDDYLFDLPGEMANEIHQSWPDNKYLVSWAALRHYEVTGGEEDYTEAAESILARKMATEAGQWMGYKLQNRGLIHHAINREN